MRFLVDECTGPGIARWLRGRGHDVFSVYDQLRGASDEEVIERARREERILITNDKDFGEKVYREGHAHRGVVLLRLVNEGLRHKQAALERLLDTHGDQLESRFVVVQEAVVRFRD
jgi:predicted nuclease of predicted toxin-antitoxin system